MNINTDEEGNFVLTRIYNPLVLKTNEGFEISICMRDWGYDIVIPASKDSKRQVIHIDAKGIKI